MSEDIFEEEIISKGKRTGKKFTMNLTPEEQEFLETLASALGKSQKEVIMEALHQYAQGKIVNWREIRGDHILATLALIREVVKIIDFIERTSARRQIKAIAEEIRSTRELYESIREIIPVEHKEETKTKDEKNEDNELLTQIILGIGYKLGLIEPVPIQELSGEEEE